MHALRSKIKFINQKSSRPNYYYNFLNSPEYIWRSDVKELQKLTVEYIGFEYISNIKVADREAFGQKVLEYLVQNSVANRDAERTSKPQAGPRRQNEAMEM